MENEGFLARSANFFRPRELTAVYAGQTVRAITRPGFARWDQISPASRLIAETITPPAGKSGSSIDLLLLGFGHCALGVALYERLHPGSLWVADTTSTALDMARRTMEANYITGVHFVTDPLQMSSFQNRFDLIAMELPKGRAFTRRWLLEAYHALKPGGVLSLAGANKEGIQPAIEDALALFGNASLQGYKKGSRVARMVKMDISTNSPGWVEEPGVKPGTWIEFDAIVGKEHYHFFSLPGVFSAGRLDEGTALLIDHLPDLASARVLDAGCGYGPIGLAAWRAGASQVDMVDNHLLSIACAMENIRRQTSGSGGTISTHAAPENQPPGKSRALRAFAADFLDLTMGDGYTHVISNPPFHAGRQVDLLSAQALIAHSFHLLLPGGQLLLVANRFLRYDRLMYDLFGNISTVLETGKYHILASTKEERLPIGSSH